MFKFCAMTFFFINAIICQDIANNFSLSRTKRSNSCGVARKSEGLIVGGNYFAKGTYPWMAALLDRSDRPPSYFCGGVLISSNRVLSAAHCILNKNEQARKLSRNIIILLGAHDLQEIYDADRISKSPKQIFIHPDWNPKIASYDADIAVLLLEEDIHFTLSIQPICLWTSNADPIANIGIVIGYGKSEDGTKLHETKPKQLVIPIVNSNEDCFLKEPRFAAISSKRTFCAGAANGNGPCLGDSGNGLFIKYNNIFYLCGLVSSSFVNEQTCDTSKYAVFTNVLRYKQWINSPSNEYVIQPKTALIKRPQLHRKILYDDSFCGIMSNSAGLVQGGQFSKQDQFPWMAIIKGYDKGAWTNHGAGSLITVKHAISTPVFVSYLDSSNFWISVRVELVRVQLGTTKYDDLSQPGSLEIGVVKIVNHPNAKVAVPKLLDINQVSVVTLEREIVFTQFIRPVCLWPFGDDLNDIVGRDAYGVGYGIDQTGKQSLTRKHIRMTLTAIDQLCRNAFTKEVEFQHVTKMFCAKGNDNETPCYLDQHLYMKIGSKWYLKGVLGAYADWINGTCDTKKPTLCEDIAPYVSWILFQTQ